VQGVYSPPRDDYATTPGNAQILFTCLPLMASWLVLTAYKLLAEWMQGASGEVNHVLQVREYTYRSQYRSESTFNYWPSGCKGLVERSTMFYRSQSTLIEASTGQRVHLTTGRVDARG
jgi:hypothetical protein